LGISMGSGIRKKCGLGISDDTVYKNRSVETREENLELRNSGKEKKAFLFPS